MRTITQQDRMRALATVCALVLESTSETKAVQALSLCERLAPRTVDGEGLPFKIIMREESHEMVYRTWGELALRLHEWRAMREIARGKERARVERIRAQNKSIVPKHSANSEIPRLPEVRLLAPRREKARRQCKRKRVLGALAFELNQIPDIHGATWEWEKGWKKVSEYQVIEVEQRVQVRPSNLKRLRPLDVSARGKRVIVLHHN